MTMLRSSISLFLPHYCCSCGEIGTVLCEGCKHDIVSEISPKCLHCGHLSYDGACSSCALPYSRGWFVGERRDSLAQLIDISKYRSVRAGCDMQAELLLTTVPQLPANSVVVPVPTIARHIRQRGYGHAERIASRFARSRGVSLQRVVQRRKQHVQQGSPRQQRLRQADESYYVSRTLDPHATYIVVDDVYTTGATVKAVSESLRLAGATTVWVAVTSRQPLDDKG